MAQADKCSCRTINLAKEGHTPEERRCKMIVYEKKYHDVPYVCGPPIELGLRDTHPSAKKIRIATAADMRTICPPPICTCPKAEPPLTLMLLLKKLLKSGIKVAILGTVVGITVQAGVWKDAKTTECLYVEWKNIVQGTDYTCRESGAPRMDLMLHHCRQRWNHYVSCGFNCVNNLWIKMTKPECEEDDKKEIDTIKK